MFAFSLIIFLGSLGWIYFEPGWEPTLFSISTLAALVLNESHVKRYFSEKVRGWKTKKIPIENGSIVVSDEDILDIVRPLCLGKDLLYVFEDKGAKELAEHARKYLSDKNEKFYAFAQVHRSSSEIDLVNSGFKIIVYLYKKGIINVAIDRIPEIFKNYVKLVYSSSTGHPNYSERSKPFDIYSNNVTDGQIHFVADIPEAIVEKILIKLNISSTQQLAIPYQYSLLDLPDNAVYEYVVPAQILAALTRFTSLKSEDNFWAIHNWAFGPH